MLENPISLRRTLGVSDGVALLIGISIGSGIYTTPYLIAGHFYSFWGIMATWLCVGALVMVGGLIYAELGSRLPDTGGEYVYISRCYGPFAGFMFGWAQLFIIRTSPTAGLALVAADYVGFFADLDKSGKITVALAFILSIGVLNYVGIRWASLFQKTTTLVKVVGLVLFAVGGLLLLRGVPNLINTAAAPITDIGFMSNLIAALMLIVFTHTGFDRVGYVAGEMKDPKRVIPRTMVIGIIIVLVIYWAVNIVYHYTLGIEGMRATETPAAQVATVMVGSAGAGLVALLAIVSALGSINGTTMAASRVYFAMARDGLFFRSLDYVHPKFRTPTRAIVAHVVWACVILLIRGSFATLAAGMVFAILIFYTMTTLALFKLRRQDVGGDGAYRMPLYPYLPILYLISIIGLLVARGFYYWEASLHDLAFVATGLPICWFWLRQQRGNGSSPQGGDALPPGRDGVLSGSF